MKESVKRGAGILMPVSSLPSRYGIGTFGIESYRFVDMLVKSGQTYWQVLPLGPTSYGDSPYQSPSAFAGNPYFIDLDVLVSEGLLNTSEAVKSYKKGNPEYVDYAALYKRRYPVLRKACERFFKTEEQKEFEKFLNSTPWLKDYAMFMALKDKYNGAVWSEWNEDIRFRKPEAVNTVSLELADDIRFYEFLQYEFFKQWNKLKSYANERGISIIGDMPIYVSYDSADVWASPALFRLDENLKQKEVAGCPPDDFSEDGQKWGNPLYNWDIHEADDFIWFKGRMTALKALYDIIRIDHFIGIVRYYCIPFDKSAKYGWYERGPGRKLTRAIVSAIGSDSIIAEDLGALTPQVTAVLKAEGFPGMKVLEFAFDGGPSNDHLPHNLIKNCVAYIGTHDNEPLRAFLDTRTPKQMKYIKEYLDVTEEEEIFDRMVNVLFASVADTVILQMQDVLKLPVSARINLPSTVGENWKWRMKKNAFTAQKAKELKRLAKLYGRYMEEI